MGSQTPRGGTPSAPGENAPGIGAGTPTRKENAGERGGSWGRCSPPRGEGGNQRLAESAKFASHRGAQGAQETPVAANASARDQDRKGLRPLYRRGADDSKIGANIHAPRNRSRPGPPGETEGERPKGKDLPRAKFALDRSPPKIAKLRSRCKPPKGSVNPKRLKFVPRVGNLESGLTHLENVTRSTTCKVRPRPEIQPEWNGPLVCGF